MVKNIILTSLIMFSVSSFKLYLYGDAFSDADFDDVNRLFKNDSFLKSMKKLSPLIYLMTKISLE